MSETISREAALALLRQYNKEPFLLRHALTVEAVMGCEEEFGVEIEITDNPKTIGDFVALVESLLG